MPSSASLTLLVLVAGSGLQSEAVSTFAQGPSAPGPTAAALPREGDGERGRGRGAAPRGGLASPSLLFYAEGAGAAGAAAPLLTHAVIAAKRLTHLPLTLHCSPVPPS